MISDDEKEPITELDTAEFGEEPSTGDGTTLIEHWEKGANGEDISKK
jgi:hypothetical protein